MGTLTPAGGPRPTYDGGNGGGSSSASSWTIASADIAFPPGRWRLRLGDLARCRSAAQTVAARTRSVLATDLGRGAPDRSDERGTEAAGADLLVIASDVVYPAGGATEYEEKFYRPHADLPWPILAVPGNHDWYDGCSGFLLHLCGVEDPHPRRRPAPDDLERMRAHRGAPEQQIHQPAPYWALDTGPLRVASTPASSA